MKCFSYIGRLVYVGVIGVSRHLKEELAWATVKWLQVISNIKSNIMYNVILWRTKINYSMCCVVLTKLVMYSNCLD